MPGYQTLAVNPASALAPAASLQGCATTSLESCFASMSNGQYASLVNNAQASSNAVAGLFNNIVAQAQTGYTTNEERALNFFNNTYSSAVNKNDLKHQDQGLLQKARNSVLSTHNPIMHFVTSGLHAVGKGLSVVGSGLQWLVNQATNTK